MITTTIVVFLLAQAALFATNQIDIRFSTPSVDHTTKSLYVDIQVKAHDKSLILAGQNYRIFYDSEKLSLDQNNSEISLPQEKYTNLKFHSSVEGIDATGSGELTFDDNLGFVNFSVDLKDHKHGGIQVSSGQLWTTVATLKFNLKQDAEDIELVWGRDGKSDEYATAYVEMAEWLSPKKISSLMVNEFGDLAYNIEDEVIADIASFEFGPNPSTDFVKVEFDKSLKNGVQVRFINMAGVVVQTNTVLSGNISALIDLTAVPAGNYLLEVENLSNKNKLRSAKKLSIMK